MDLLSLLCLQPILASQSQVTDYPKWTGALSTAAAASPLLLSLCFNCRRVGHVKKFCPLWGLQQVESEDVMDIVVNTVLCSV